MNPPRITPVIAGPPYCSGRFHIGHAVNQVCKDFWNRLHTLAPRKGGHDCICPVVFDAQGLPSQIATEKRGVRRGGDAADWIRACNDTVRHNAQVMLQDLRRLRVLPETTSPDKVVYTTDKAYKVYLMDKIGELWAKGDVYPAVVSSRYCRACRCVLAKAQIETKKSQKAKVTLMKFPLKDSHLKIVVATTQPQTYVNMQGVAVGEGEYGVYQYQGEQLISGHAFHPQAKRVASVHPTQYQVAMHKTCPIYLAPQVHTSPTASGNPLTDVAGVLVSPSHSPRDLHMHSRQAPSIVSQVHHTWQERRDRYFKELDAPTYGQYLLAEVPDTSREIDCCWRCGEKAADLLQQDWFLKTDRIRAPLVAWLDTLIADGKIVGLQHMGSRIRKWWATPHDWAITRSREYLTPLPLGRCHKGCPDIRRLWVDVEDVQHEWQLYASTLQGPLRRNGKNQCPCGGHIRPLGLGMTVWLDSGILPMYLGQKAKTLIEGKDQDVGWYYAITVVNLLCGQAPPYESLQFTGWALEKPGVKLSKSKTAHSETTLIQRLVQEYGVQRLRSYLICCASNKDYVHDERQLYDERKFTNLSRHISLFLHGLPHHDVPSPQLARWAQADGDDLWVSHGKALSEKYQQVLTTGQLRSFWLYLRQYALHTFSRSVIKGYKAQAAPTPSRIAGLHLTGRLLLGLYGAGLGHQPSQPLYFYEG